MKTENFIIKLDRIKAKKSLDNYLKDCGFSVLTKETFPQNDVVLFCASKWPDLLPNGIEYNKIQ